MQKVIDEICCFVGYRKIEKTNKLKQAVYDYVENLIVDENVKEFLFNCFFNA